MAPPKASQTYPSHESNSQMTKSSASTPAAADAAMTTESVTIRKASNGGFIANCSRRGESGKSDGIGGNYENKDYAFSSLDEVLEFVSDEFGGGEDAPDADAGAGDEDTDDETLG